MKRAAALALAATLVVFSVQGLAVTQNQLISLVETNSGEFYGSFRVKAGNSQFLQVSLQDWNIQPDGTQQLAEERPDSLNSFIQGVYTTKREIENLNEEAIKKAKKQNLPFRLNLESPKTIIVKGKIPENLKNKFLWGGLKLIYASEKKKGGVTVAKGVLHKLYYEPKDVEPKRPEIKISRKEEKLKITIKNKSQKRIFVPQEEAFFRITEAQKGKSKDIPAQKNFLVLPGKKLIVEFELQNLLKKIQTESDIYNIAFAVPFNEKFFGGQIKLKLN